MRTRRGVPQRIRTRRDLAEEAEMPSNEKSDALILLKPPTPVKRSRTKLPRTLLLRAFRVSIFDFVEGVRDEYPSVLNASSAPLGWSNASPFTCGRYPFPAASPQVGGSQPSVT